ncbi:MAG: DUF5719 family protein [Acidimicrobiales bacterium]
MSGFRWPILVLLPALIIAALLIDGGRPSAEPAPLAEARTATVVRPNSSAAATWFCVAGVIDRDVTAAVTTHSIEIVNVGDQQRLLRIVAYNAETVAGIEPESLPLTIDAGQRLTIASELVGSTMVEVDGGGVIVEHVIGNEIGSDSRPCASTSAARWEFPAGETIQGTHETIVLFNPFPEDAVAQLAFTADTGRRIPTKFEAVVIPSRTYKVYDVSAEIAQAETASASVIVNAGRVIANRVIVKTDRGEGSGLTAAAGTPTASLVSYLPVAKFAANRPTSITVYNPTEERAEVDIEIHIGSDVVIPEFEIPVPALQRQRIDLTAADRMKILAAGERGYSVVVRSANGVPVVSELSQLSVGGDAAVEGMSTMIGSPVAASRWIVDVPITAGDAGSSLILFNPSFKTIARVELQLVDANQNRILLPEIELGTGGRRAILLSELGVTSASVLILESGSPIVAAREIISLSSISMSLGIPDASTLAEEADGFGF